MRGAKAEIIIQERDRHLLKELGKFRVVDREQAKIIAILLGAGARVSEPDEKGRSVLGACSNERIRMLLEHAG